MTMVKMLETLKILGNQEVHVYKHTTHAQAMEAFQAKITEQDRKAMEQFQELMKQIDIVVNMK
jgi:hypothetical protein